MSTPIGPADDAVPGLPAMYLPHNFAMDEFNKAVANDAVDRRHITIEMATKPDINEVEMARIVDGVLYEVERNAQLFNIDDYAVTQIPQHTRKRMFPRIVQALQSGMFMQMFPFEFPTPNVPLTLAAAVQPAWSSPFLGQSHTLLYSILKDMSYTGANDANKDSYYLNQASILQSSGSGKSRMVDEVARKIFTIPFCLRPDVETRINAAFPPPDSLIRDFMTKNHGDTADLYLSVLCATFLVAQRELLKASFQLSYPSLETLAEAWRAHLAEGNTRISFFKDVKDCASRCSRMGPQAIMTLVHAKHSLSHAAEQALQELLDAIKTKVPNSGDAMRHLRVLLYFDEAHVLTNKRGKGLDSTNAVPKMALDYLAEALNELRSMPLFALFLSTQLDIEYFAPSVFLARSARIRNQLPNVPAPITETPFDCFGSQAIVPQRLEARHTSDVVFMSLFGRPLWRSMMTKYTGGVLDQVCIKKKGLAQFPQDPLRATMCRELINLARSKLICSNSIEAPRSQSELLAQTACVDARVMLPFEPGRFSANRQQMELISSHMRTVFSVTQARDVVRSGYPSEPILAEAAARQLHHWATLAGEDSNPMLDILKMNLDNDLLDRGKLGAVVARSILLAARDRAAVTHHRNKAEPPHFTAPVPVVLFIEELLGHDVAQALLCSYPDNVASDDRQCRPLRQVFEHSVLNFSHFGKFADDSALSQDAALASFLRGMAIVPRNGAPGVDVGLPIVLDHRMPLSSENMTMLICQFKRRQIVKSAASTEIDLKPLGLFPPDQPKLSPEEQPDRRPAITMTMEVGATAPVPLPTKTPTDRESKDAVKTRAFTPRTASDERPPSSKSDTYNVPQPRLDPSSTHPRYAVFIHGCSSNVYRVIRPVEDSLYQQILQCGNLLGDHPRQDLDALLAVRNQKPFFSVGPWCFHWIENEFLNPNRP